MGNGLFYKLKVMRKSILTIEDSGALNYLYNKIFEKEFNVSSVTNFFQAFRHLQTKSFSDLIIINIPDIKSDNYKFLKHISTSSLFCDIPKVIISKSDDVELKNEVLNFGVSLFISMPFDPLFLAGKIKEILYEKEVIRTVRKQRFFSFGFFPL